MGEVLTSRLKNPERHAPICPHHHEWCELAKSGTTLLVVFGALALVIASLGLYGLLAHTVSARSREIGIRMALGATWRSVMQMVMSRVDPMLVLRDH